jgi:hypothetical protein
VAARTSALYIRRQALWPHGRRPARMAAVPRQLARFACAAQRAQRAGRRAHNSPRGPAYMQAPTPCRNHCGSPPRQNMSGRLCCGHNKAKHGAVHECISWRGRLCLDNLSLSPCVAYPCKCLADTKDNHPELPELYCVHCHHAHGPPALAKTATPAVEQPGMARRPNVVAVPPIWPRSSNQARIRYGAGG